MKRLTLSDYQALAEFRFQIRKFLHFSEQAVQASGLERGQYQLMLAIKGMPEGVRPRIRELADRMQIQHHSAVELINRLEAGDLSGGSGRRTTGARCCWRSLRRANGCWRSWRCIITKNCAARLRAW